MRALLAYMFHLDWFSTAVSMRPMSIRIDIFDSCERFPSKCCV